MNAIADLSRANVALAKPDGLDRKARRGSRAVEVRTWQRLWAR